MSTEISSSSQKKMYLFVENNIHIYIYIIRFRFYTVLSLCWYYILTSHIIEFSECILPIRRPSNVGEKWFEVLQHKADEHCSHPRPSSPESSWCTFLKSTAMAHRLPESAGGATVPDMSVPQTWAGSSPVWFHLVATCPGACGGSVVDC